MKEHPIFFSGPMIRAILDGRKIQTRRVVKLPHQNPLGQWEPIEVGGLNGGRLANGETLPLQASIWHTRTGDSLLCPFGIPGDRLWVRETTFDVERNGYVGPVFVESPEGEQALAWGWGEPDDPDYIEPYELRRRPAIHMSRAMARIRLEVTDVRVERLQDIKEADARAEGVTIDERDMNGYCAGEYSPCIRAFYELWDSLNAARGHSWDANPWVWVLEFRRVVR